jgi:hypothetical protein
MTHPEHERRAQYGDGDARYGGAQRPDSAITDDGKGGQHNRS